MTDVFNGKWTLETSENLDDYLIAIGDFIFVFKYFQNDELLFW